MARIRTIKPEFFRHESLFEAEQESKLPLRIAFAGLWTVADREGRFRWQPRILKLDVLPFDNVDFSTVLEALCRYGFVVKYQVNNDTFGFIPSWSKHQSINQREADSSLPSPDKACANICKHVQTDSLQNNESPPLFPPTPPYYPPEGKGRGRGKGKGKGREGEGDCGKSRNAAGNSFRKTSTDRT